MKLFDFILPFQTVIANEAGGVSTWVQLSPYGEFSNAQGMQEVTRADADEIVKNFASESGALRKMGLPFYIGHPDHERFTGRYKDTKSYGRVRKMQAREDGLYGEVFFNEGGRQLVESQSFHGHSVNWAVKPDAHKSRVYHPVRLKSVGFTNEPAIPVEPITLANEEQNMNEIAKALGLAADADAAAIIKAIMDLKGQTSESKPEEVEAISNELKALKEKEVTIANEIKSKDEAITLANQKLTEADTKIVNITADLTKSADLVKATETRFANERKAHIAEVIELGIQTGRITKADQPKWETDLANEFESKRTAMIAIAPTIGSGPELGKQEHANPAQRGERFLQMVNERMDKTKEVYADAFYHVQLAHPDYFKK